MLLLKVFLRGDSFSHDEVEVLLYSVIDRCFVFVCQPHLYHQGSLNNRNTSRVQLNCTTTLQLPKWIKTLSETVPTQQWNLHKWGIYYRTVVVNCISFNSGYLKINSDGHFIVCRRLFMQSLSDVLEDTMCSSLPTCIRWMHAQMKSLW